jgi:glutaredoxin
LFGARFPKSRPSWLLSKTGFLLELDGYSEQLGIAFEHHGTYHYEIDGRYSTDAKALKRRKKGDAEKRRICKNHGILLIEIPEVPGRLRVKELLPYIAAQLEAGGRTLPESQLHQSIDLIGAYKPSKLYSALLERAQSMGGRLISDYYVDKDSPLEWGCSKGHRWRSSAASVYYQKSWCPHCAGTIKKSLVELESFAHEKNGHCLSKTYVDARSPLRWRCVNGHEWEASATNVLNKNSWCPYCAGQRGSCFTIEYMRSIARKRGGDCLSKEYINSKSHLDWVCGKGHRWRAIPLNVVNKKLCSPRCAHPKPKEIITIGL